ncbi:MAG: zonular occludens toxin domain-containing protein [Oscillospiraceae bacterium]
MITLLTGKPGNGKTSHTINLIKQYLDKGFNVYTHGIPNLRDLNVLPVSKKVILNWFDNDQVNIEHLIAEQSKTDTQQLLDHEIFEDQEEILYQLKYFPKKSLIVVDECQFIFGRLGSKATLHQMALSVHRRFGVDFLFITQDPEFLCDYLVKNTSRHFHIGLFWHGRKILEFAECCNNPSADFALKRAISNKRYKPDPSTFKHYLSASEHNKLSFSIPKQFFIALAIFIIAPILIFNSLDHFNDKFYSDKKPKNSIQPNKLNTQNHLKSDQKKSIIFSTCIFNSTLGNCSCYDQQLKKINKLFTHSDCTAFNATVL